jgi:hypothetical protein
MNEKNKCSWQFGRNFYAYFFRESFICIVSSDFR